jgi:hypothetical protein
MHHHNLSSKTKDGKAECVALAKAVVTGQEPWIFDQTEANGAC